MFVLRPANPRSSPACRGSSSLRGKSQLSLAGSITQQLKMKVARGPLPPRSRLPLVGRCAGHASSAGRTDPCASAFASIRASTTLPTAETLEAIHGLERECFGSEAWSLEDISRSASHGFARVAVARSDDDGNGASVRGYLLSWSLGDEIQLLRLGVSPRCQRRGLGRDLVIDLQRYASDCCAGEIDAITLEVREGNAPAIQLYSGLGFGRMAKRKQYYSPSPRYPQGESAILMKYLL